MRPSGPIPADVAIVGEAPGEHEIAAGLPFVGPSGRLLTALLHSAGVIRSSCFITNVCNHRPPDNNIDEWFSDNKNNPHPGEWQYYKGRWCHPYILAGVEQLNTQLAEVRPKLVVALGNTALWALTPYTGIGKWRGSRLALEPFTVLPSIHPAAALRMQEMLPVLQMDLKRIPRILSGEQKARDYQFEVAPDADATLARLEGFLRDPRPLACDIETRAGLTACIGFAWSEVNAICIPFMRAGRVDPWFWPIEVETAIRHTIYRILHAATPENPIIFQHGLYDCQYLANEGMGYPRHVVDTMIGHHSLYSNLRKGLDFISSMYCDDHVYWKDESKNWDPALGERQLWVYNCKDACTTWEAWFKILSQRDQEAARRATLSPYPEVEDAPF